MLMDRVCELLNADFKGKNYIYHVHTYTAERAACFVAVSSF